MPALLDILAPLLPLNKPQETAEVLSIWPA
jgi:hypothetical protein